MRNSLQLKLLAAFMLVITVTLGTVIWGISAFFKDQILAGKQQELLKKGMELSSVVHSFQEEAGSLDRLDEYLANADQYLDARIWIIDDSHQIVAMSGYHPPGKQVRGPGFGPGGHGPLGNGMGLSPIGGVRGLLNDLEPVFSGEVVMKTMDQPYYGEKMVVVAVPIMAIDGSGSGAVLLNAPVTGINAFMQRIYYYVGAGGLAALLLALLVVNHLTRAIVRPLTAMEEAAGTLAKGNYATRVEAKSNDEIGRLGHAFNELAQNLANYMAKMEKTEKMRRDFVANVSHELRTPLTIMRGYTEALLDGTAEPAQSTKYLRTMQEETVRLEHLVKDLLDLSRLQSETAAWKTEPIPLPAIVESVFHMVKPVAEQENISLLLEVDNAVPDILGNDDRLAQLLLIFLDNALKHTMSGGKITVSVAANPNEVMLSIADTGVGIAAEDLPYIWDRFYKADKSHTRTESGAGLGLAIAKQIIDRHRAVAEVTSELGQGTTFFIHFQYSQQNLI